MIERPPLLARLLDHLRGLSARRINAVLIKEFIQLRRDRVTFGMILGVPLLELVLFGFAINNDPKQLPTAIFVQDHSAYSRAVVNAFENSGYFRIVSVNDAEVQGDRQLARGEVAFVVTIPEGFTRQLLRREQPQLLLEADSTDPAASSNALAAATQLTRTALAHQRLGAAGADSGQPPFDLVMHRRYNPDGISQYNTVPGLLGVILTMTMVMMPALALTREVERGTMENLLALPVRPMEMMIGKLLPYIAMGAVQVVIILTVAHGVFEVPMQGSYPLLCVMLALFIATVSTMGYLISTVARNQMQAMQMTFFFFLPSMLLSGFMFPFRGMPAWAQGIGEVLPLTHFLRIVRGIMLKGGGFADVAPNIWPLLLFLVVVSAIALSRFRHTLDS
ncbi:MAG: ABC transporter permease [Gammaproteobacteria bacterium]|nr:ABC transporter permease [Gammaproteobacteria bacterium]